MEYLRDSCFRLRWEDNFLRFTVSSMSLSSMTYEAELHIETRPLFWGVPEQDWLQVTVRQSKDQRETTKSNNRK